MDHSTIDNDIRFQTDIRLIKYKDYILRNPAKAIGYYGLARTYLDADSCNIAEELFLKALEKKPGFTPAKISLLEVYMLQGKFLKAILYYEKNRQAFESKRVFMSQAAAAVTSVYDKHKALVKKPVKIFPIDILLKFKETAGRLKKTAGKARKNTGGGGNRNRAAMAIFCMHSIANKAKDPKSVDLYREFVKIRGISDSLRLDILNQLAKKDSGLYNDREIAALFKTIPARTSPGYANVIFDSAVTSCNPYRIENFYREMERNSWMITPKNLWKYVAWSRSMSKLDESVHECCRRLIRAGWMDRTLAETLFELSGQKGFSLTPEETELLELFGYLQPNPH